MTQITGENRKRRLWSINEKQKGKVEIFVTDKKKRKYRRYKNKHSGHRKNPDIKYDFQTRDTVFSEDIDTEFGGRKKPVKGQKKMEGGREKNRLKNKKISAKAEYSYKRVSGRKEKGQRDGPADGRKENIFEKDSLVKITDMTYSDFLHDQSLEEEDDNSASEALKQSQQKAKDSYRFVKRYKRGRNQRQHKRAEAFEKKQFKKEVRFQYQKFLEENPQIQEKTLKRQLQKRIQKQRIKREYVKAKRLGETAKNAKDVAKRSANTLTSIAKKIQEILGKKASLFVSAGISGILLIMVMTSVSSCGAMFSGGMSTVLAGSYMSRPAQIDAADLVLSELERDLQEKIDAVEADYPDYDEYRYNLAAIGHDPFALISYLSAVHTEFTAAEVKSEVESLFNEMYYLTLTPTTETRTRTVTKTGTRTVTDPQRERKRKKRMSMKKRRNTP